MFATRPPIALDGAVVARDIRDGTVRWAQPDVAVDDEGESPAGGLGVVIDDVLVTVSGPNAVGLATADGSSAWDAPVPFSNGGRSLGEALTVSAADGLAVVAAQAGDAAFDPRSGAVAWREQRPPLIVADDSNIWVGTADRLVAGQQEGVVRSISTEDGSLVAALDLADGGMAVASTSVFVDGLAVLSDTGASAYALDDLSPRWEQGAAAGARSITAVDGGVLVLGEAGISLLRTP